MHLLFDHFDQLTQTPENLKSLRQWIIDLGVRGQLTQAWREAHPTTEPASVLLEKIRAEKAKLVKERKIKKGKPLPPITANEVPYDLPEEWVWCRLGSITNYGISKKVEPEGILPETWVLDLEDIVKETNELLNRHTFSERDSQSTKNVFNAGDVLYSKLRPYLDKVIVADQIGVCTTEILPLTPEGDINPNYLRLSLKSKRFQTYVNSVTKGMKMPRLGTNEGRMAVLPLPPLAEQQAIVEKVESLLAKVSQLQVRAGEVEASKAQVGQSVCGWLADAPLGGETARRFHSVAPQFNEVFSTLPNLKVLRQTILQLAIQGKLTEAWRAAHAAVEPASALLERIQTEKARLVKEKKIKKPKALPPITEDEVPFDLPEGWVWCRLGGIGTITGGGTPSKGNPKYWNGDILWVSPKDMKCEVIIDSGLKITLEAVEGSSAKLVPEGSLLIVGRSGILKRKIPVAINAVECTVNQDMKVLIPYLRFMNRYLQLMLFGMEDFILQNLVKFGMTVHSLKYDDFEQQPFPLPPLAEQQAIVEKVETLLAKVSQLEQEVEQNRQYAEQLLQSVLREVMQGTRPATETTTQP